MEVEQFAEIVRRHQAGVCAVAYGVTGDRALSEDIAQDTFVVAWRGVAALRDPSRLRGWLHGIARNLARKARRRRRPVGLEGGEIAAPGDPVQEAVARDEARVAWAALHALPARCREALVLYYWEGESARGVARALGISEAAAMQRLSRGRALLRDGIRRQVEGALRRARPGAALTAAIVAAITAASAGTARAAAATSARRLTRGLSRRVLCQAGLALAAPAVLGALGVRFAARSGRRRTGGTDRPIDATAAGAPPPPAAGRRHHAPAAVPGEPEAPAAPSRPIDPTLAGADEPSIGGPMLAAVTGEDGPAGWARPLLGPLSVCFVDELVDRPCWIAVEVRGGAIVAAAVEPFEGADRRVVIRTLEDAPAILRPAELRAWLAADRLLHRVRDAELADGDAAMPVGSFVELCAQVRLAGLRVGGPDGTRRVRFGWAREVPRTIDRQAYRDLDVATGPAQGPASALVTVVSFLDIGHRWGFGRASLAAWRQVLASYSRDVRLVVKLCPLFADHELAAEAVYAAGAQGGFLPMLDRVAADPVRQGLDDLVAHARAIGLDGSRLRDDLERRAFRAAVELDQDHRLAMEIDALPSALVNGQRVHGALPVATCLDAVARAVQRARGANATAARQGS
jgi:RNA polymerase sigma factor (sigma-70 family)